MKLSRLKIYILIICIIVCIGCNDENQTDLLSFDIENLEGRIIKFDDVFEIEKIVVLEESEESLVSHIIKVEYINNYFYISDNRHSIILRFNANGQYINSIGAKGNGPGEVIRLTSFQIENEYMYLLDRTKVIKYKIDGTFIDEFSKPYYTIDFNINDGACTLYNINVPSYDQIIKYDTSFSLRTSFSPNREMPLVMGTLGRNYFYNLNNEFYYTYPYADTIYKLVDTISTPYISFGFGKSKFTDFNGLYNRSLSDDISEISYSYKDFILKDQIICSLVINGDSKFFVYDKATGRFILIDSIEEGPDLINGSNLHNVTKDGQLCWAYSVMSMNDSFKALLKNIETNGNEVLIITRLKKDIFFN